MTRCCMQGAVAHFQRFPAHDHTADEPKSHESVERFIEGSNTAADSGKLML